VTGKFFTSAAFSTTTLTGNGMDIFLARYDPDGNLLWVRGAGGNNVIYGDAGLGLAADSDCNAFITGYFSGTGSFGTNTSSSAGFDDIFCCAYDSTGGLLWVRRAGGSNLDIAYGAACDAFGNVFLAGFFASNPISFDAITLTNDGSRDVFVAMLGSAAPGPVPPLSAFFSDGQINLLWPADATGVQLETAADLAQVVWDHVPSGTNVSCTNRLVTLPCTDPQRFFRLHRP